MIYCVEDERNIRELLIYTLETTGFKARVFGNGNELMKALKEEYHRLAKQYHPDVCGDRRSQQIFQEILNERAEILERMAKE